MMPLICLLILIKEIDYFQSTKAKKAKQCRLTRKFYESVDVRFNLYPTPPVFSLVNWSPDYIYYC